MPGVSPDERARVASVPLMRRGASGAARVDEDTGFSFDCVSADGCRQRGAWCGGAECLGSGDQRAVGASGHCGLGAGLYGSPGGCVDEAGVEPRLAVAEQLAYRVQRGRAEVVATNGIPGGVVAIPTMGVVDFVAAGGHGAAGGRVADEAVAPAGDH